MLARSRTAFSPRFSNAPNLTKVIVSVAMVAALPFSLPSAAAAHAGTESTGVAEARPAPSGSQVSRTVVASGLNNPRHLSIGPDGTIYVAESGTGGPAPCSEGPEGEECFGLSASVTAITNSGQKTIAEGLPSLAGEGGFAATGVSDVAVAADGTVRALIGLGRDPVVRTDVFEPAGGALLGQVVSIESDGSAVAVLDVAAFEGSDNPDGGEIDSNPNALLATEDGYLIVDAGANALLSFDGTNLATVAVFPEVLVPAPPFIPVPEIPMQAVPTSVAVGPDGAYYVGQLTGFPFPPGMAQVFRVDPDTGEVTVFADGFTNIIDIEFAPDGTLYVLQISSSGILSEQFDGAVLRVRSDGTTEIVEENLFAPGGLAISADGDLYVSNCGICPGAGEVLLLNDGAPEFDVAYTTGSDRSAATPLAGAEISGMAYVFVSPLAPDDDIERVEFFLDDVPFRTEFLSPYDFAARAAGPWDSSTVSDGSHTITAVAFLAGGSTTVTSATFTTANGVAPVDSGLAYSNNRQRSDRLDLNGAVVEGTIWAFVFPIFPPGHESVENVAFTLDGAAFRTEFLAPYDFAGSGPGWDTTTVADGEHTIVATATISGGPPMMATATFTVANDGPPPPTEPPPAGQNIVAGIAKAPIVPDGDVAGAVTDFVVTLDRSLDPAVDGRSLATGNSIRVTLPDDFVDNGLDTASPGTPRCAPGPCNVGVLLQGWPQHPIAPPAAKYTLETDGSHTFVYTALEDLGPSGAGEPGIKQIHLILLGFTNPAPGGYEIEVETQTGEGGAVETGTGTLTIRPEIAPSINITSAFNDGTPNTIYQSTAVGQATPFAYDFLLFDGTGGAMTGVTLENGELMRDGSRVGEVSISAPDGATGQSVTVAAPSIEVMAPVLGKPAGRLTASFAAGSAEGDYEVTFSLDGGTSVTMFVEVVPAPPDTGYLTDEDPFITLDSALPGDATVKGLISSGETLGDFTFEGLPDGIGIRPGPDPDTVDVYVAHEQTTIPFFGSRDFQGASVSKLTLSTIAGENQGAILDADVALSPDAGFLRFCSASMAGPDEGLDDYVFFTGEETTDTVDGIQRGFAVALNTRTGEHVPVPGMGRLNHESVVVVPGGWDDLAMLTTDDTFSAPSSQLYMYLAEDQDAIFADTGSLYALRITGVDGTPLADATDPHNGANDYLDLDVGEEFQAEFIPVPRDVAVGDQTALEDWSNANNVYQSIRLEDAAVDKSDGRVVYMADTGATRVLPDPATGQMMRGPSGTEGLADNGRIFKMVLNADDPTIVDSLSILADGDAVGTDVYVPFTSPDNIDTSMQSLMVQEDTDGARIWQLNFGQNSWRSVATINDPDGESSGIVDASAWFGSGSWLLDVQGHGMNVEEETVEDILIKRESGQLMLLTIPGS